MQEYLVDFKFLQRSYGENDSKTPQTQLCGVAQTAFVLSTHNFSENYPLKLPNAVELDYWTFYGQKQAEMEAEVLGRKKKAGRKHRKKQLSNKQMFIHDLWTDYGMYLRKWIEKIRNFNSEEEIPEDHLDASGTVDVYQEFIDCYTEKEYAVRCFGGRNHQATFFCTDEKDCFPGCTVKCPHKDKRPGE